MPLENRRIKKIFPLWEHFNQSLSNYIPAENKKRKNKNFKDFLLNAKIWKTSLRNMGDKILSFQFKPVPTEPTRPSYKFKKFCFTF